MNELNDSFATLLGRSPSDAELQQLYRVRDALGLKNNDALWLVLMALQHYQTQYEEMPGRIAQSARTTLGEFKDAADRIINASTGEAKADLAKAVATAAGQVARDTATKQKWQWIFATVLLILLGVGGGAWYSNDRGHTDGYNSGYGVGYKEAKDEKAAASWANTPEGKLAYRFSLSGELTKLAHCVNPGWKIKSGTCVPFADAADKNRTTGWTMP